MINLLGSVTSAESYGKAVDQLHKSMGEIWVMAPKAQVFDADAPDAEFDRTAFKALKAKVHKAKR
ncbi:hypothetical protein [Phyllobacterium myrsinacearum]|uniref:Uncharacterized protein n=1 Tax=Phyllobacterium myrsinacearum TaxID=28101 RepID=A0A839EZ41_9HYPH|nr:hypothetical protein [Phyllobacterium myrsinacearum]MBA8881730.1 hypothetical protein [Phyllobacterium myrsinacearum]